MGRECYGPSVCYVPRCPGTIPGELHYPLHTATMPTASAKFWREMSMHEMASGSRLQSNVTPEKCTTSVPI